MQNVVVVVARGAGRSAGRKKIIITIMQTMEIIIAMITMTTTIMAKHTMKTMTIIITTTRNLNEIQKVNQNNRLSQRNQIYHREIRTNPVGEDIDVQNSQS